jgi:hypothetical protein
MPIEVRHKSRFETQLRVLQWNHPQNPAPLRLGAMDLLAGGERLPLGNGTEPWHHPDHSPFPAGSGDGGVRIAPWMNGISRRMRTHRGRRYGARGAQHARPAETGVHHRRPSSASSRADEQVISASGTDDSHHGGLAVFTPTRLIVVSVAPQTRSFRSGIGAVGFPLAAKVVDEDLHRDVKGGDHRTSSSLSGFCSKRGIAIFQ